MKPYDIIIIGAGPAGTSAALFLEKLGYRIALLDQARFPRDKVCGEFISPAADAILSKLGVLDAIEAVNPIRLKGVALSAYERSWLQVDYPTSIDGVVMTSLSMERSTLDHILLNLNFDISIFFRFLINVYNSLVRCCLWLVKMPDKVLKPALITIGVCFICPLIVKLDCKARV